MRVIEEQEFRLAATLLDNDETEGILTSYIGCVFGVAAWRGFHRGHWPTHLPVNPVLAERHPLRNLPWPTAGKCTPSRHPSREP